MSNPDTNHAAGAGQLARSGSRAVIAFDCAGERLFGLLDLAEGEAHTGVLIVVGGPQYRVGSHRQFVHLSRTLAQRGVPCMRFDYRGMGDSAGAMRSFEEVNDDIRSAIDAFFVAVPALQRVVLWGLCDGASAACFYAYRDIRVAGLALANPWVRTESSEAQTYLQHYYLRRLGDRELWTKVLHGEFEFGASLKSAAGMIWQVSRQRLNEMISPSPATAEASEIDPALPLPERLARSFGRFQGPALILLSGNDYTATEFESFAASSSAWHAAAQPQRLTVERLPQADHTFSTRVWKDSVADVTLRWLGQQFPAPPYAAAPPSPSDQSAASS